ncbi:MAG TPA: DUF2291 family protein [Opitutaceae bacterium]|nr:DUF2291 family protein [Opitutaceae bacterium]
MRRPWGIFLAGALLLAAAALFPPVRFHRLRAERPAAAGFQAPAYARKFWRERLLPAGERAAPASEVLAALRRDPAAAEKKYGRTIGDSDTRYFFFQGTGTVVADGKSGVALALAGGGADLIFPTGFLFGNAVRDASGLLDPGAFANSQDFNAVAAELNHLVETRVLPALRDGARPGRRLRFVAAAEVDPDDGPARPLPAVPVEAAFE